MSYFGRAQTHLKISEIRLEKHQRGKIKEKISTRVRHERPKQTASKQTNKQTNNKIKNQVQQKEKLNFL